MRKDSVESAKLDTTYFTPEGFIVDNPIVARIGVQEYPQLDGSVRREARLPEHVFSEASLESYEGKDVILTHYTDKGGLIDGENFRDYTIGNIINAYRDGDYVRCKIMIKDVEALRNNPGLRQLSLSYTPDMVEESGEFNGEAYDSIQTNILINNLAVVETARAGEKVRLHIDQKEEQEVDKAAIDTPAMEEDKGLIQDSGDIRTKLDALKGRTLDENDFPVILEIIEEIIESQMPTTDKEPENQDEGEKGLVEGLEKLVDKYYENKEDSDTSIHIDPEDEESAFIKLDGYLKMREAGEKLGIDTSKMNVSAVKKEIVKKALPGVRLDGRDLETLYSLSLDAIAKRKPIISQYEGMVRADGVQRPANNAQAVRDKRMEEIFGGVK